MPVSTASIATAAHALTDSGHISSRAVPNATGVAVTSATVMTTVMKSHGPTPRARARLANSWYPQNANIDPNTSRSPSTVATPRAGPLLNTITNPTRLTMPHRSAFQFGCSPNITIPAGINTSGAIALMNSPCATLVLVMPRNNRAMFTPKHSAGGTLSVQVGFEGSAVPFRMRRPTSSIHHRTPDTTSRHQAITDPGIPGH